MVDIFAKVNDPDTARYYKHLFELVNIPTRSVSESSGLSPERRITKGEKEIPKIRADVFFSLKQGEFITYADGKDLKVQFKLQDIKRELPIGLKKYSNEELETNFERVYEEARSIFNDKIKE